MKSSTGLHVGSKLVVITIFLLAAQCASQPNQEAPATRGVGYTASIDNRKNGVVPPLGPKLLLRSSTGSHELWLQADPKNRCALSLRLAHTNSIYRLVWTANYFAVTPGGCDKCTVIFTKEGDLQLHILYRGRTSMAWNTKTGGRNVKSMYLPNTGDLQLRNADKKVIFSSFGVREWAMLPPQRLRVGEVLKSPDQDQEAVGADSTVQVLFNNGQYFLTLQKTGDLQLIMNGPKPQVYWSLKKTLFKGNLKQVAYAAINKDGGLGLFTQNNQLVWGSPPPPKGFYASPYFGIDTYGNLKTYYAFKNHAWFSSFKAFDNNCDLPNHCGDYSICSGADSKCSCPPQFTKTGIRSNAPYCKRNSNVAKCSRKSFLELKGYDANINMYINPKRIGLTSCKASCLASCDCDGFYYDMATAFCHQTTRFRTLRKVNNQKKLVYIKM